MELRKSYPEGTLTITNRGGSWAGAVRKRRGGDSVREETAETLDPLQSREKCFWRDIC